MTMPVIRDIRESDNPAMASILRATLVEFNVKLDGTAYYDASTDDLYSFFRHPASKYFIAELDGYVVGGAGIYPTQHLPEGTCELVKMYLLPNVRNIGLGSKLIVQCLDFAKTAGYKQVYIETMPELRKAVSLYKKFGFEHLDGPMGMTEHYGCSIWMLKRLD
ncbi:MAG TPA: GNAT family N-acetyltransferase [Flavitalea sp.]|nr:GNAT family N-acetyltransferase [Flavitalea sp.]